jgi:hypothetical protein
MRGLVLLISICASMVFKTTAQNSDGPELSWEKPTYDFGDIYQGEKVEHTFKFVNSGKEPLVITNVQVTCGCTTPKGWPRDPIMPGGKAELVVLFDSSNKIGRQNKVVTVVSNASGGNSQISFSANVLEKKKD